jgi:hypothetical protein
MCLVCADELSERRLVESAYRPEIQTVVGAQGSGRIEWDAEA